MAGPLLVEMMLDDDADGLLSLSDLADLVATGPTVSAFSKQAAAGFSSGSDACCASAHEPRELAAPDSGNWANGPASLSKFKAPEQHRPAELPGSFDAWLSYADSYGGVAGQPGERPASSPRYHPMRRYESFDSDCASAPDGYDLHAMGSRSSMGSSATTLSAAASCALSSAANSGDDLAALVHTNCTYGPRSTSSILTSPLSGLPFDCLPDSDEPAWPGFGSDTSATSPDAQAHSSALGVPTGATRAAASQMQKGESRVHGGHYWVGACGSDWAVDASCFWIFPGCDVGLGSGASGVTTAAELELSPRAQGLPIAATARSALTAQLAPGSALPSFASSASQPGPSLPSFLPSWPPSASAAEPLQLPAICSSHFDGCAPTARSFPRTTSSGMVKLPTGAEGAAGSCPTCSSPAHGLPAVAIGPAVHGVPPERGTALEPLPSREGLADAVAADVPETRCDAQDASRSMLDEAVHGGRPRRGHGGLALAALASSGWIVGSCCSSGGSSSSVTTAAASEAVEAPPSHTAGSVDRLCESGAVGRGDASGGDCGGGGCACASNAVGSLCCASRLPAVHVGAAVATAANECHRKTIRDERVHGQSRALVEAERASWETLPI